MIDSFVYRRFSFILAIAFVLGVVVANSQQSAADSTAGMNNNTDRFFEIPCEELKTCRNQAENFFPDRA